MSIIPAYITSPTPATTLNKVERKTERRQQTIAGDQTLLPVIYGTDKIGGKISATIVYNNKLYVRVDWCLGEVDAISSVLVDDAPLVSGVLHYPYKGGADNIVNSQLQTAFAWAGKSYTDTLPGIAYSVFVFPAATSLGFPRFSAKIRGLKVRTTQAGARSYQDNAAYIIADFIESTTYGMGKSVNWASVATLAAVNDTTVGGERKRITNITLDTSQPGETWLQVMRDYAGCWIVPEGSVYRLVPDTTGSPVASFTTSNMIASTFKWGTKSMLDSPTGVICEFTNTSTSPWRTDRAQAYAPGVEAGTTRRVVTRISKPGIHRYSEANRYAIERLNGYLLGDLWCSFTADDATLSLQVGELIEVTHPCGLTNKVMRAIKIDPVEPGRWAIAAEEYDPAKYSSIVATGPTVEDTDWPDPNSPPSPFFVVQEEGDEKYFQDATGVWQHRVYFAAVYTLWPFFRQIIFEFLGTNSNGPILETTTQLASTATLSGSTMQFLYRTPPLWGAGDYYVRIRTVSISGAENTSIRRVWALGKTALPGNVPSLTAFEAGGQVFLRWDPAVDLDIWRYELRYGSTAGSWDTATLIDTFDGLTYTATGIPSGTWRFYVKAIDSVKQYSATAATKDVTVTIDASSFTLGSKVFDEIGAPTLTLMTAYTLRPDPKTYYVSDRDDQLAQGYSSADSVGTFASDGLASTPFAAQQTAGTTKFVTATWDLGQDLTANLIGDITYTDLVGTASYWLETATEAAPTTWTQWAGGSTRTTCRYVRLRLETTGVMMVESGSSVRMDAYAREETGTATLTAPNHITISLSSKYASAKAIQLTPKGTGVRIAVYDNIVLSLTGANSFDIYLLDASGTAQSGDVSWVFQGV